jgi:hypothetical protein
MSCKRGHSVIKNRDLARLVSLKVIVCVFVQWTKYVYTIKHYNMKYRQGIGSLAIFSHVPVQYGDT